MIQYKVVNILDMIDSVGEEELQNILSDYTCPRNREIEYFTKKSALEFSKKKMSITYLVLDHNSNLTSIFSLTHKAIEVNSEGLSNTLKKKLRRYANPNGTDNNLSISAFLIAQLGKNYTNEAFLPSGIELISFSIDILKKAQYLVGGGVIYLECENNEKLLSFYQNELNGFSIFGSRFSETENIEYIRLLKVF